MLYKFHINNYLFHEKKRSLAQYIICVLHDSGGLLVRICYSHNHSNSSIDSTPGKKKDLITISRVNVLN